MDQHPELPRELAHLSWLDLDSEDGQAYWASMELMGRYAAANHACIHRHIAEHLGVEVLLDVENHHNFAWKEKHDGKDVFADMPNPFTATRYHSLVVKRDSLPDCFDITAETEEGEIMGLRHKEHPIWGVQFHPESILTEAGRTIMRNFLKLGT